MRTFIRNIFVFLFLLLSWASAYGEQWGIVNVSVCNTRSDPYYSAGQESQALLGMPVRVLDHKNEWTRIETPEGYVHWTLGSTLKEVSRQELTQWNQKRQLVVTNLFSLVYQKPSRKSQTVSDAVAGDRFCLLGRKGKFYHVLFPDGREGWIPRSEAEPLDVWRAHISRESDAIIRTAFRLVGVPYMWAGTSPKGVDCSGFVRTVLYMHDIIIPRNASQQAQKGERIKIDPDFANVQPGDLLFFGSGERVVHVGIYLGNKRFIHSLGFVHENSFDPQDPLYDEYDRHRLLFASRMLPYINKEKGLFTTDQSEFYR